MRTIINRIKAQVGHSIVCGTFYLLIAIFVPNNLLGGNVDHVFNVMDFGALGNGVHNDQTNIQMAIDAAETNSGGGSVYLPPGTYLVGTNYGHPDYLSEGSPSRLTIRSNNITLNGAGIDLVTVKASPAVWGANFFGSNNTTNLTLANFTIDGNNAPSDITQFYSNKNILFKRIRFKNGLADAVDTQYGESVFIQDCLFENISDNAVSGQDSYCEVLNSRIIGAGFSGAPVFGTYNGMLKLQNVWIEDCVDIFGPAGSFAPVEGCTFLFTNSAVTNIIIDSYQYMKFVNCTFGSKSSDTTIPMIAVRTNAVANFNNCIFQSARAAIFADRPAALTVRDCEFLGAGHCIKARGPSRYIIQNNIFKTDGGSGNAVRLDTTPPASGFVFSGNTLDGCHFYETDGSTNIIQNNILINGAGFNISGSAITGTKIIGNTVSGATTSLDVYEGGLVIANNNFDGDINFHGSGYTNTFVNNLFKTLTGTLSGINTNGNSNVKF